LTPRYHSGTVFSRVPIDLDKPCLGAADVAEIAQTDILNIHTWTTRGFADVYHDKPSVRRAGGRARSYSIRDALRFFLMARLHKQYRTPLPQGMQICQSVFAKENFDPERAAYLVLEEGVSGIGQVAWFGNLRDLEQHLADEPVSLVINVKRILNQVASATTPLLAVRR
jgi:hypothetical protein